MDAINSNLESLRYQFRSIKFYLRVPSSIGLIGWNIQRKDKRSLRWRVQIITNQLLLHFALLRLLIPFVGIAAAQPLTYPCALLISKVSGVLAFRTYGFIQ